MSEEWSPYDRYANAKPELCPSGAHLGPGCLCTAQHESLLDDPPARCPVGVEGTVPPVNRGDLFCTQCKLWFASTSEFISRNGLRYDPPPLPCPCSSGAVCERHRF